MSSEILADNIDNEHKYLKAFGKELKNLRLNNTQKSLRLFSYETDVPCATLSRLENGTRIPNLIILKRLAAGFDCSVFELIENIEKNIPDNIKNFDI